MVPYVTRYKIREALFNVGLHVNLITCKPTLNKASLQQNHDNNMPHCFSYGCSNSTGTDSISALSFCYPLNRPEN